MKVKSSWIVVLLLAAVTVVAVVWYRHTSAEKTSDSESDTPQEMSAELSDDETTNGATYFEEGMPPADPMMVGKWCNTVNPHWYKVYYDDFEEDENNGGYFWGKEWDESQDVHETDLRYHGNGWFRWQKKKRTLLELSTMDMRDVCIPKEFRILRLGRDTLIFVDHLDRSKQYEFVRVE